MENKGLELAVTDTKVMTMYLVAAGIRTELAYYSFTNNVTAF